MIYCDSCVSHDTQGTNLNPEVLFYDILNEEGEAFLPRWVFGGVNHLRETDGGGRQIDQQCLRPLGSTE